MWATPINDDRRTVVVVPLSTSGTPRPPLAISVQCMGKKVVAVCDQIRAIDKSRLLEKAGIITKEYLLELEKGLRQTLVL